MTNGQIDIAKMMGQIEVEDVYDIKNPAYIVKAVEDGEKGCVVAWNKGLENLTNFSPADIDNNVCNEIFDIYQRQQGTYKKVCSERCMLRDKNARINAGVLKECWINAKYRKGLNYEDIKKCVDIYVFPFDLRDKRFALHMLIDKEGVHERKYFNEKLVKKPLSFFSINKKLYVNMKINSSYGWEIMCGKIGYRLYHKCEA